MSPWGLWILSRVKVFPEGWLPIAPPNQAILFWGEARIIPYWHRIMGMSA